MMQSGKIHVQNSGTASKVKCQQCNVTGQASHYKQTKLYDGNTTHSQTVQAQDQRLLKKIYFYKVCSRAKRGLGVFILQYTKFILYNRTCCVYSLSHTEMQLRHLKLQLISVMRSMTCSVPVPVEKA